MSDPRHPFKPTPAQLREAAFNTLFKHLRAMSKLYTTVREQAPEEAEVGKAVAEYLEKHREKMRKETTKP